MYQNFFQLSQRAFCVTPDTNLLYKTPSVEQSLQVLEQVLCQGEGIGLLTSPAGTGKTLICKALRERLDCNCSACNPDADSAIEDIQNALGMKTASILPLPVLLLHPQFPTRRSLLQAILFELNRDYARMTEQELRLELISYGREVAKSHTGIAIIVDEAHLLAEHILEELRGLTNYMYCAEPIFRVVLSGQLELEETLTSRSMEAVNQRLAAHVTLETLTRQQSAEYIATRIEYCGAKCEEVFTPEALELIVHAADGLPRCLNQLCDHACLLASLNGNKPVEEAIVREALEDLMKLPLHWNIPTPRLDPAQELTGSQNDYEDSEEEALESAVEFAADSDARDDVVDMQKAREEYEAEQTQVFETESELESEPEPQDEHCDEIFQSDDAAEPTTVFEIGGELSAEPLLEETVEEPENEVDPIVMDQQEPQEVFEEVETEVEEVSFDLGEESDVADLVEEILEQEYQENNVHRDQLSEIEQVFPAALLDAEQSPEQEEEIWEQQVHDRYADLDAKRLGQLADVASTEPALHVNQFGSPAVLEKDCEQQAGQSVLELTTELAAAIGEAEGDIVPNPDDIIVTAMEMLEEDQSDPEYDIVDPE